MANEIEKASAIDIYRGIVADRAKTAADMTLHQLVDEFQRLTEIIDKDRSFDDADRKVYSVAGIVAIKERHVFSSMASARFGISLAAYDDLEYDNF